MMNWIVPIYYTLIHLAFLTWGTFAVWYGITRRWEETPEGINTFITSAGLTLLFGIVITGIWFHGQPWRIAVVLIGVAILVVAGFHRLTFLWKSRKGTRGLHE